MKTFICNLRSGLTRDWLVRAGLTDLHVLDRYISYNSRPWDGSRKDGVGSPYDNSITLMVNNLTSVK